MTKAHIERLIADGIRDRQRLQFERDIADQRLQLLDELLRCASRLLREAPEADATGCRLKVVRGTVAP